MLETLKAISLLLDDIVKKFEKSDKKDLESLLSEIESKLNIIRFKNNQEK